MERVKERFQDLFHLQSYLAHSYCLLQSPQTLSPLIQSRLIWDFKRCSMLKTLSLDLSLSVSRLLCLLSLSHPLQDFTLHIPFAGCYLEQWFHLLQKTVPHLFRVGERKKRKKNFSALVILSAISTFFVIIISNIQKNDYLTMLCVICQTQCWNWCRLFSLNSMKCTFFLFFFHFFLTVHQPSFDPLERIRHSQIKRTWQGIYKQPHATFSLETPPFSLTLLSLWSIYCQTSVLYLCFRLIHCIFTLLPPTWDD